MIRLIAALSGGLLLVSGFAAWKISDLYQDLGAAEADCAVRIQKMRSDALGEVEAAREAARERQALLKLEFQHDVDLLQAALSREVERRQHAEADFSQLLDSLDSQEVQEWYVFPVPESVLGLP
jgi:hypothetical protein